MVRALFVVILVLGGLLNAAGAGPSAARQENAPAESTGTGAPLQSSLKVEIYDMFAVPYGQWWEWRFGSGERPVGAACFNQSDCDNPETYPYMNWRPWMGSRSDVIVDAPYRMHISGVDQPGSTLAFPVLLPVANASQAPGDLLHIQWNMTYLDEGRFAALQAQSCPLTNQNKDGFATESTVTVIMDLQESRRLFGVLAATPAGAQAWWAANAAQGCQTLGPLQRLWQQFLQGQANVVYDVWNSFSYEYDPLFTRMDFTVEPVTGVTTLSIDHGAWGLESLLARWFHWGTSSYRANAEADPGNYSGWWRWEFPWFEDLHFNATVGARSQDFTLNTVIQYHLQAYANPGPDGIYHNSTVASADDVGEWLWQPYLADSLFSKAPAPVSELDAYRGLAYDHGNPGSLTYGIRAAYEFVPAAWDLGPGDMIVIRLPTQPVRVVDPYSPMDSSAASVRLLPAQIGLYRSTPSLPLGSSATDANGDGILDTITLRGPLAWGAPLRPLWGFPALEFAPQAPLRVAVAADPRGGVAPLQVSFTSTVTGGVAPYTYAWAFGDGITSGEPSPRHEYVRPGAYRAWLVVTDALGSRVNGTVNLSMMAALGVTIGADQAEGVGSLTVHFVGETSGGTSPYTYEWSFGDGTFSTGGTPTHTYSSPGTYAVTLKVRDQGGLVATGIYTVTVRPNAPIYTSLMVIAPAATLAAIAGGAVALTRRRRPRA